MISEVSLASTIKNVPRTSDRPVHAMLYIMNKQTQSWDDHSLLEHLRSWFETHWGAVAWKIMEEGMKKFASFRSGCNIFHRELDRSILSLDPVKYPEQIIAKATSYISYLSQLISELSPEEDRSLALSLKIRIGHCLISGEAPEISSMRIERASIIFNTAMSIAATTGAKNLQSKFAEETSPEVLFKNLDVATRALCTSAEILRRLSEEISFQPPAHYRSHLDLSVPTLETYRSLFLAQAQECVYYRARNVLADDYKTLASLAKGCSEYYSRILSNKPLSATDALKHRMLPMPEQKVRSEAIDIVRKWGIMDIHFPYAGTYYDYFRAMCLWHQADLASIIVKPNNIGNRVGYVQKALEIIEVRYNENKDLLLFISLTWACTSPSASPYRNKAISFLKRLQRDTDESRFASASLPQQPDDGDEENDSDSDGEQQERDAVDSDDDDDGDANDVQLCKSIIQMACKADVTCRIMQGIVDSLLRDKKNLEAGLEYANVAFRLSPTAQGADESSVRDALNIQPTFFVETEKDLYDSAAVDMLFKPSPSALKDCLSKARSSGRESRQLMSQITSSKPMPDGGDGSIPKSPAASSQYFQLMAALEPHLIRLTIERESVCSKFRAKLADLQEESCDFAKAHPDLLVYAIFASYCYHSLDLGDSFYFKPLLPILKEFKSKSGSSLHTLREQLQTQNALCAELLRAARDHLRDLPDSHTHRNLTSMLDHYKDTIAHTELVDENLCKSVTANMATWQEMAMTPNSALFSMILTDNELELHQTFDSLLDEDRENVKRKQSILCGRLGISHEHLTQLVELANQFNNIICDEIALQGETWDALVKEDGIEEFKGELLRKIQYNMPDAKKKVDAALLLNQHSIDNTLLSLVETGVLEKFASTQVQGRAALDVVVSVVSERKWAGAIRDIEVQLAKQAEFFKKWQSKTVGKNPLRTGALSSLHGSRLYPWFEASRAHAAIVKMRDCSIRFYEDLQRKLVMLQSHCERFKKRVQEAQEAKRQEELKLIMEEKRLEQEAAAQAKTTQKPRKQWAVAPSTLLIPPPSEIISKPTIQNPDLQMRLPREERIAARSIYGSGAVLGGDVDVENLPSLIDVSMGKVSVTGQKKN